MKKIVYITFLLVLLLTLLYTVRKGKEDDFCHLTIIGSSSIMPFAEKLSEHFMEAHKGFLIDVQGGGSTAGIQATIEGTAQIGMSSRELKDEEKILKTHIICYDSIVVIVHPQNPIMDIGLKDVRDIYTGRKRSWKDFGWVERGIDAITREEGSGTRASFEDLVMEGEHIYEGIMVQDSNGSVREIVANDPYAIGYISLGIVDQRVKALSIEGVAPTLENVKKKRYRFVRPFILLTKTDPEGCTKAFISYVLSSEGQRILKQEGLIPVK